MGRPKGSFKKRPDHRCRPDGRGIVTLAGKDYYTGVYGTPDAESKYLRLLAEYTARGGVAPGAGPEVATVIELVGAFWSWAKARYAASGAHRNFKVPLRTLNELYGATPIADFTVMSLIAVRQQFVDRRCTMGKNVGDPVSLHVINRMTGVVKKVFRWGKNRGMVPASVTFALSELEALVPGETGAPVLPPVVSADEALVDATLSFLPEVVRAMVELQRLTGMRASEVCVMRTIDIDMSDPECWFYTPMKHKGLWRGKPRVVAIAGRSTPTGAADDSGRRTAQDILRPWLKPDLTDFLFTVARLNEDTRAIRMRTAKGKRRRLDYAREYDRQRRREKGLKPKKILPHITGTVFARTIMEACDAAFPLPARLARLDVSHGNRKRPERIAAWRERIGEAAWAEVERWREEHRWHSHQLRHGLTTRAERIIGEKAAGELIGHTNAKSTARYVDPKTRQELKQMALRIA